MKNARTKCLAAALAAAAIALAGGAEAKELVVAVQSTFTTLDPYDASDTLSQAVAKSFYEGLYGFDRNMKRIPVLAESAEASADGLVYTIKLKQGVKFHDGTEFTADAVKANFDRVTDPKNGLKRIVLYSNIAKTEVVDPYTVRFTLKKPFSAFLNQLAHPSGAMICPSALEKWGGKVAVHPCGTGPYTMKEYNPSEILHVVKNPNYRVAGLPKLDGIVWKPVVENSTRAAMLRTGEAQFAMSLPPEQVKLLQEEGNVTIEASPSIITRYLSMNVLKKPFDNPKVRQAINYAINKEALAKVAFSGFAHPATGPAPAGVQYATKLGPWPYNPQKARELLKEAGYPNGFRAKLWSAYNHTTANKAIQFLQQQLAQVGIKCDIQALEAGQRVALVEDVKDPKDAQVELYYIGWSSSTGELDWAIRPLLATESWAPKGSNTAYYSSKTVDDGLMEALATTDEAKKQAIYDKVQKQIWDDAPWAFLVDEDNLSAYSKNLTGFYTMPDANIDFYQAELK